MDVNDEDVTEGNAAAKRTRRWVAFALAAPLIGLWGFRGLVLYERFVWRHPLGFGSLIALGLDVLLAASLVASAAYVAYLPRVAVRIILRVLLAAALAFDLFFRGADVVYYTLTGTHLSAAAFRYIGSENKGLLLEGTAPWLLGLLGSCLIACLVAWTVGSQDAPRVRGKLALSGVPLVSALLVLIGLLASSTPTLAYAPEGIALREWMRGRGLYGAADLSALELPASTRKHLVEEGILPAQPLFPGYPLSNVSTQDIAFPYPDAPDALTDRPNVVLTLVESFNQEYLYSSSGELQGLMPRLSELSKRMTSVSEYRSVALPTINAVVAALCSIHNSESQKTLNYRRGGHDLKENGLRCLPEILRDAGYHTVYVQAANNEFADTEGFLKAHGFERTLSKPELHAAMPKAELTRWGVHDDAMVAYAKRQIAQLEAQRKLDGKPFFLMVQTIDMHDPGYWSPACKVPASVTKLGSDAESLPMVKATYCTDDALGDLVLN
ncbi:MAG TPA: LTA synthase family protein, partial [Polyangiales bacterium]|nr:LTA synthase family protein [Polyangiales bacterium]